MDWKFVANCLVTILAILDPFGALAMFLAILGDATHEQRRRGARLATLTVLSTLIVAMLFGRQLLTLLGICMRAFRVAGGMIILLTGLKMLSGQLGQERRACEALTKVSLQRARYRRRLLVSPSQIHNKRNQKPLCRNAGAVSSQGGEGRTIPKSGNDTTGGVGHGTSLVLAHRRLGCGCARRGDGRQPIPRASLGPPCPPVLR
jgi:hypothetical protein